MKQTADTIRKAAILVSSLDSFSADTLLDQMGEELATCVRRAAMDLGDVSESEEQRTIQEFLHAGALVPDSEQSGIELDDSLLERIRSTEDPPVALPEPAPERFAPGPFDSLRDTEPEILASVLANENPQAIAVVLSHLEPHVASKALEGLPDVLQVATLRRLSDLGSMSPEIVREVESHVGGLLAECKQTAARRAAGVQTVKKILSQAEFDNRSSMLGMLAQQDNDLAVQLGGEKLADAAGKATRDQQWALPDESYETDHECEVDVAAAWRARSWSQQSDAPWRIERSMGDDDAPAPIEDPPAPETIDEHSWSKTCPPEHQVVRIGFDQLDTLSGSDLAMVFSSVEPAIAAIGLATACPAIQERIDQVLGTSTAAVWRREVDSMGPMSLGDIEYAQEQLGQAAVRLARDGKICLPATRVA